METELNPIERRVLGALMEKALAQPQYYPMTLNAVTVVCNQKTSRDPVMNLDEEAVWSALETLRERGLAARVMAAGSRVERYKHQAADHFGWSVPQRAIMAELLLRGPQTVGELRGHCSRMHNFETVEAVQDLLNGFAEAAPPMVRMLPRGAGQSAVRYAHTLYPAGESAALAAPIDPRAETGARAAAGAASDAAAADIEALRSEVAALREELSELRRRLDAWAGP